MKGLKNQLMITRNKVRNAVMNFYNDETGAIGIKEIAMTVAVIVVIGFVITIVDTNMGTWIGELWDRFNDMLDDFTA